MNMTFNPLLKHEHFCGDTTCLSCPIYISYHSNLIKYRYSCTITMIRHVLYDLGIEDKF